MVFLPLLASFLCLQSLVFQFRDVKELFSRDLFSVFFPLHQWWGLLSSLNSVLLPLAKR